MKSKPETREQKRTEIAEQIKDWAGEEVNVRELIHGLVASHTNCLYSAWEFLKEEVETEIKKIEERSKAFSHLEAMAEELAELTQSIKDPELREYLDQATEDLEARVSDFHDKDFNVSSF